jgi:hypothetical protein
MECWIDSLTVRTILWTATRTTRAAAGASTIATRLGTLPILVSIVWLAAISINWSLAVWTTGALSVCAVISCAIRIYELASTIAVNKRTGRAGQAGEVRVRSSALRAYSCNNLMVWSALNALIVHIYINAVAWKINALVVY